jgi:1-acyl-sn-glycerol-3-phosphate acyltransferase
VEILFGAPLDLSDLGALSAGQARREATERIMGAIQALSGQERAEKFAEGSTGA